MKKKILLLTMMFVTMFSGCSNWDNKKLTLDITESTTKIQEDIQKNKMKNATDTGKVLRIYCWNEEFKNLFSNYYAYKLPSDIQVEWVITPNDDNGYQNKLDQDLLNQEYVSDDQKIDIFLIETDYALKYTDTPYTLDVKGDIGLADVELAKQYRYTKEIVTDSNGLLKGVSWQATPGLFAYRRSIAKEVLGTDDPLEVQKALSDWDSFDETAVKMKDNGYKMLSGYYDSYRTFSNNQAGSWVQGNVITIDENLLRWVEQTKEYTDKGYNNNTTLWSDEWEADQGPNGSVFGFFYSTWGINFTLLGNSLGDADGPKEVGNGIYGDWAVCEGPQNYYWGGSWICAAAGTDNKSIVKDVMYTLTCHKDTMKKITEDTQDYTNNMEAMNELAISDYKSKFLGGQNHIALFAAAAPKIDMRNISPYDQGLNEEFQNAFKDYFEGKVSKEEALQNFYMAATEKYPFLSH